MSSRYVMIRSLCLEPWFCGMAWLLWLTKYAILVVVLLCSWVHSCSLVWCWGNIMHNGGGATTMPCHIVATLCVVWYKAILLTHHSTRNYVLRVSSFGPELIGIMHSASPRLIRQPRLPLVFLSTTVSCRKITSESESTSTVHTQVAHVLHVHASPHHVVRSLTWSCWEIRRQILWRTSLLFLCPGFLFLLSLGVRCPAPVVS